MSAHRKLVLAALLVLVAVPALSGEVEKQVAIDRAAVQADRQAIVAENLPLSAEQAKAFWPVFREYRAEMSRVGDRITDLVLGFAKDYDTLTDAQAMKMVEEFVAVQKDEARIKAEWVPKFAKVVPPKTLARFYQIDNKLDVILRMDAAAGIPLVRTGQPKP